MNRFIIPAAVAALVVGCARPAVTGLAPYSAEPSYAPAETTVIVREVHYQEPVVYTDTVYLPVETESSEPVYVGDEYNEYNEYNETYVYVSEPPPPHHRRPGWSPREHEQRPSRPPRDERKFRPRDEKPEPNRPPAIVPRPPTQRTYAPVTVDRRKSPGPPTPPYKPTPPKRQSPAQNGSAPAAQVQHEVPRQVPAPTVDKPATPTSDQVQVSLAEPVRK